ncbi:uncharacterized protein BDZ83DRAFT_624583 [Colletotrichum acutatum]|uniref:Secreted protein n=1 Tax=Glomerella acutata TaxID=27357 RepID=A0AAD8XGG6_GLOAC|nr:uncharacterized protein BDZ83DRAFT_624583 [Colletotrichum acutatum]KAK1723913.1 hypothetical protein BDZ83DRAFT_624583 [Colletotrichum acutatum]
MPTRRGRSNLILAHLSVFPPCLSFPPVSAGPLLALRWPVSPLPMPNGSPDHASPCRKDRSSLLFRRFGLGLLIWPRQCNRKAVKLALELFKYCPYLCAKSSYAGLRCAHCSPCEKARKGRAQHRQV